MNTYLNKVINGDGIVEIKGIPDEFVHLILSDIPYGIGAEDWDVLHDNKNSAYLGGSNELSELNLSFR